MLLYFDLLDNNANTLLPFNMFDTESSEMLYFLTQLRCNEPLPPLLLLSYSRGNIVLFLKQSSFNEIPRAENFEK